MRKATQCMLAVAILLSLALLATSLVLAEIPKRINYQGRLTDVGTGEAISGSHEMVFRIYDALEGGTELWSESSSVIADSAGVFSVILGTVNPLNLTFDSPIWLEVVVGGEVLAPRREIVSVPFAFYAETAGEAVDAESLGGHDVGDFIRLGQTGVITTEMIVGGTGSGLDADKVDGYDAAAFSDTSHTHDDRYVHKDSLGTQGTVNNPSNPVAWTRLKGVPDGLADGVDDVGGAGDGHSLDAADGEPVDAVYVDDEGYVGIGTTTPAERLHLTGPTARILIEGAASDPEIDLASPVDPPENGWRIYRNRGSGDLRFAQDGDRMSIKYQTGNVGIGTSSAGERLVVDGNVSLSGHLKMEGANVFSVDGTANTFLGKDAGFSNTGSSNTLVGEAAGYLNGPGMENVFVGDSTGLSNTGGFYDVFVGHVAGQSNTVGQDNTFVGSRAGRSNDDGSWNTFVGSGAGMANVGPHDNTFVGAYSGSANSGGSGNTCLGMEAGGNNTNGGMNTCLGAFTGPEGDGDGNVLIGYMAGLGRSLSGKLLIANGPESTDVLVSGDFTSGNVGLGTLNPTRRLQVTSPTSNFGMLVLENSNTGYNEASIGFRPGRDATGADTWVAGAGAWGHAGDFVIGRGEPKMVITDGGLVGIGITNPSTALQVERQSICWISSVAHGFEGIAGLGLTNDNTGWEVDVRGDLADVFAISNTDFPWAPHLAIEHDGDVGIGTEAPERKLHVKGAGPRVLIESTSGAPEVNFKHTGDASSDVWAIYKEGTSEDLRFYQGGDKIWIKGGTGNVGIGGSPGANKLYVNGSGCYTGSWGGCSDVRFKREIEDVAGAVDKVMGLRGVTFLWRSDEYRGKNFDTGRHYGLIAQEAEEVLPEVVLEGADGEKAVAYTEIVPVLIEAIKAQQKHIEALEERITGLEAQIDSKR